MAVVLSYYDEVDYHLHAVALCDHHLAIWIIDWGTSPFFCGSHAQVTLKGMLSTGKLTYVE